MGAGGFLPDSADPDWSSAEKANFGTSPAAIKFVGAAGVVAVERNATGVQISSAAQNNADIISRTAQLNGEAVPVSVTEQIAKNKALSEYLLNQAAASGAASNSVTFPSDYARQGEAASAASAVNAQIAHLGESSAAPAEPVVPAASGFADVFFPSTFSNLTAWQLPGHASQCPTSSFSAFGQSFTIDAHCGLLADHSAPLEAAMVVVWSLLALFIVLRA
jgi:hypothetical protein